MLDQADNVVIAAPGDAEPAADGVRVCASMADLAAFKAPNTELVIWQRTLPPGLHDWLEQLPAPVLPDLRILVKPKDLRPALNPMLNDCGMASGEMRDLLVADIADLVEVFARITECARVDVRLERVDDDACWKFHRDSVEARLLTTYRGPTTEWIRLPHGEQAIRDQRAFSGPLERLDAHDVALFNGNRAGTGSGIVHRSPPIAGTGVTRLLLCLNKPTAASPDPWVASADPSTHAGILRGWTEPEAPS